MVLSVFSFTHYVLLHFYCYSLNTHYISFCICRQIMWLFPYAAASADSSFMQIICTNVWRWTRRKQMMLQDKWLKQLRFVCIANTVVTLLETKKKHYLFCFWIFLQFCWLAFDKQSQWHVHCFMHHFFVCWKVVQMQGIVTCDHKKTHNTHTHRQTHSIGAYIVCHTSWVVVVRQTINLAYGPK